MSIKWRSRITFAAVIAVNAAVGGTFNLVVAAFVAGVWLDKELSVWR